MSSTEQIEQRKNEIAAWRRRIDQSAKLSEAFIKDAKKNYRQIWDRMWDAEKPDSYLPDSMEPESRRYNYDLLLSYLKTEMPNLMLYLPEVFLTIKEGSKSMDSIAELSTNVKRMENHVNMILHDMDGLEAELKAVIMDAFLFFGVSKLQFTPRFIIDSQGGEYLDGLSFDIERANPFNILIDKYCKNNPYKSAWIGERITRTAADMKTFGLYDSDALGRLVDKSNSNGNQQEDWEIEITFYELYDLVDKKMFVIAEDLDDEYLRAEDMEINPYDFLLFSIIPGQFYAKPDMSSGRQMAIDYNDGRRWMKDGARKSRPIIANTGSPIKEPELKKIRDGTSDIIVLPMGADLKPISIDFKAVEALKEHMFNTLNDFDSVMGQAQQNRGLTGSSKLATEMEIVEAHGQKKETERVRIVRTFLSRVIEKLIFLIKRYYPLIQEDSLPNVIIGQQASRMTLSDYDIDYRIDIDVDSKSPKNKAIERKQLAEAMAIVAQNPIFLKSPTLMDRLLRDYDVRNRDQVIKELNEAINAEAQAAGDDKSQISIALNPNWELMSSEETRAIMSIILNRLGVSQDNAGESTERAAGKGGHMTQPERGTKGMAPGSGLMPSGEIL